METAQNATEQANVGAGMPSSSSPQTTQSVSAAQAHEEIQAAGEPPQAQPSAPAGAAASPKNPAAPAGSGKKPGAPKAKPAGDKISDDEAFRELQNNVKYLMEQNEKLQQENHKLANELAVKTGASAHDHANRHRSVPGPSNASAFANSTPRVEPERSEIVQHDPATHRGVQHTFKKDTAFMCMVFMAEEATCYKNISFKKLQPQFEPMIHKHVCRNVDSKGRRQTETQSQCGHWHPVVFTVDQATGRPKAICQPPIHEVTRITESGRVVRSIEPIVFRREKNNGQIEDIVDDHVHEMRYMFSEELSRQMIKDKLAADREEAGSQGIGFSSADVKSFVPAPLTPEDGYTLE